MIEFQLRSNSGGLSHIQNVNEVVKQLSQRFQSFWKVSYEQNGTQFRWEKIAKGEDIKESNLYNKKSSNYKDAQEGSIFWANKPFDLLVRLQTQVTRKQTALDLINAGVNLPKSFLEGLDDLELSTLMRILYWYVFF